MTALVVASAAMVAGAGGAWAGFAASATGTAATRTSRLPAGRRPSAELAVTGTAVTVTWAPVTLSSGSDVGGYLVRRTVVATNAVTTVCTATVPITACTDTPTSGQMVTYTVTPEAQSWSGPPSPPSAPVAIP